MWYGFRSPHFVTNFNQLSIKFFISDRVHERGADVRVDAVNAARPLPAQGAHVPLHRRHGQRRRLLHHGLAHAGELSMKQIDNY